jgi:hypothetical protein
MEATLQQLFDDKWCASIKIGHITKSYTSKNKDVVIDLLTSLNGSVIWKELPRQPKPAYDGIALYRPFHD